VGREAGYSFPFSAEVKNAWSYVPPYTHTKEWRGAYLRTEVTRKMTYFNIEKYL
jgi:hypothetical protein